MPDYVVYTQENWYRMAYVTADTPQKALEAVRGSVAEVEWGEPEYIDDVWNSEIVYDEGGNEVLVAENMEVE